MSEIIKRKAERECHCRGCDVSVPKGSPIIYTYSSRNRGQNIIFCLACANTIGHLAHSTNKRYYLYKQNGDFLCTELSEEAARSTAGDYKKSFKDIEKVLIKTLDGEFEEEV